MVNNNVILKNGIVKNIDSNTDFLPKLGLAQKRINRIALIEGLKAGNQYVVPFTVTFMDYSTWSSTFKIVKMFKQDNKDIVMVYEPKLGQFGIPFDSLRGGKFKNEFQQAYDSAIALQDTYKQDYEKMRKEFENQQFQTKVAREANVRKDSEISILKSEKAVLEVELEATQYQLTVVDNKVNEMDSDLRNKIIPLIVKFAKKDLTEMEIISKLVKLGVIK